MQSYFYLFFLLCWCLRSNIAFRFSIPSRNSFSNKIRQFSTVSQPDVNEITENEDAFGPLLDIVANVKTSKDTEILKSSLSQTLTKDLSIIRKRSTNAEILETLSLCCENKDFTNFIHHYEQLSRKKKFSFKEPAELEQLYSLIESNLHGLSVWNLGKVIEFYADLGFASYYPLTDNRLLMDKILYELLEIKRIKVPRKGKTMLKNLFLSIFHGFQKLSLSWKGLSDRQKEFFSYQLLRAVKKLPFYSDEFRELLREMTAFGIEWSELDKELRKVFLKRLIELKKKKEPMLNRDIIYYLGKMKAHKDTMHGQIVEGIIKLADAAITTKKQRGIKMDQLVSSTMFSSLL
jgi:hypothetical protein